MMRETMKRGRRIRGLLPTKIRAYVRSRRRSFEPVKIELAPLSFLRTDWVMVSQLDRIKAKKYVGEKRASLN